MSDLRRLGVLIAASGVDMIGFAMVLPLLPYYALRLDATPEQIGFIIAAFSIAQLVCAPFWGRVSDRYGRRPALLIGLSAAAIAYVVFAVADTLWLLLVSRIIQGAGGGTTAVAQAYVADTIRPADRIRALGWLSAATSLGVMLGPAIGSLAAHWGRAAPGLVAAALCLVNVAFAWRWLPESRDPGHRLVSPRRPVWHDAWEVIRHPARPVARFMWIYGAGMLGFSAMTAVLALYLNDTFGITEKTIGYVFLYFGALSFAIRSLALGPLVDRLGEVGALRVGTLTLTLGLLLYAAAGSVGALIAVMPLVPLGTALLFPATTALMSRLTAPAELGVTMGVAQTFAGVARVVSPLLATSAYQRLGGVSPFLLSAGIVAMVGVLAARITPPPSPPSASPAPPQPALPAGEG
jgi:multidrug resistance protein